MNDMKYIRHFLILLTLLTAAVSVSAQHVNKLMVPDCTVQPGNVFQLPVEVENTDDIVGVQFDLVLPGMDGETPLFYVEDTESASLTNRCNGYALNLQYVDGVYRVLIISNDNTPIAGNNGAILHIPVMVSEYVNVEEAFEPTLLNPVLTTKEGKNVLTSCDVGKFSFGLFPDFMVDNVTTASSVLKPGGPLNVSWTVKNIGHIDTSDGFTEYIYLENSDASNVRLVGTVRYDEVIHSGESVSRNTTLTLPFLLGIDGDAWVSVRVAPFSGTGEPESLRLNNSARTDNSVQVDKVLKLECDNLMVDENEVSEIKFTLSRSGDWSEEQTFMINATADSRLSFPSSVTIEQGQSVAYFTALLTDDDILQQEMSTLIDVTASGLGYEAVTTDFTLNDNEMADLEVEVSNYKIKEGETFQLTIKTTRPSDSPLEVTVTCDNDKYFKFPGKVIIPGGQNSVMVDVTAVDDEIPNLDVDALFTVSAAHHVKDEVGVILYDNDIPTLQLILTPDKVTESSGVKSVTAVLRRMGNLNGNITVHISDDAAGGLYYGNTMVEMPKGVNEVYFSLGPVDNAIKDGDRTYNVTAAVYISSCSCNATSESAGAVSAQLSVLDDDGATISLSVADGALIEGGTTTITVHRNTSTEESLNVLLTSDNDDALDYDHSVFIPAGQSSVDVIVSAKKNSLSGDSKTVVFTAKANDHGDGTCWVMLTDQSLPDAIVEAVTTEQAEAEVGEDISVSVTVKNAGNENLPEMTCVKLYRRDTKELVTTMYTTSDLQVGQSETFKRTFTLPDKVGTYTLYAVVNEAHDVKETVFTNNTSEYLEIKAIAPFVATLETDQHVYGKEASVSISGQLTGSRTANQDVEIYLMNGGTRQTLIVSSLADGSFSADWQLTPSESGHFIVGACYPGEELDTEMDAFDVYGLRRVNNSLIYCDVIVEDTFTGTLDLLNTSVLPLDDVKVEILSKPDNAEVSLNLQKEIEGNAKAQLSYQIRGLAVSEQNEWSDISAVITTAQGVSVNVLFKYYCRNKTAMLATDQQNIKTTMVKGMTREYPLILTNFGKANSGNISLVLPDFMKCASGNNIMPLNQNDSTTIILLLTPNEDMPLNIPVVGNLGIVCQNGDGLTVNFNITPVSDEKGTLKVDVMDEYTFYTAEAPHLKNAEIVIKNPVTGALVTKGHTASDGTFIAELTAGSYRLEVAAENHSSYSASVIVDPGTETLKNVNLSVEAITVSWDVEETEIKDEYEIVTTLKYETNVPVPVVELITPKRIDTDNLAVGESLIFYALMTNRGLITAKDTRLILPENTNTLKFEALAEYEGLTIAPQQSVKIPVKVTKTDGGETKRRNKPSQEGNPCYGTIGNLYFWDCGTDRKWHAYDNALQWGSCGKGGSSGGGGGGSSLTIGYHLPTITQIVNKPNNIGPSDPVVAQYASFISNLYTSSSEDEGCEPCQNSFLWKMSKCLAKRIPVISQVLTIVDWVRVPKEQLKDLATDKLTEYLIEDNEILKPVYGFVSKIVGYKEIYDDCVKPLIEDCDPGNFGVKSRNGSRKANSSYPSYITEYQNVLELMMSVVDAQYSKTLELFGDERWLSANPTELYDFRCEFGKYLSGEAHLDDVKEKKPQSVSDAMFNAFIERWNNTMDGVSSENRIDLDKLSEWNHLISQTEDVLKETGYESLKDIYEDAEKNVMDKLNIAAKSVCSTVTLQFTQNMFLTRQAFRGTLTVFNGNETVAMEDVRLTLNISNEFGDVATSREFQINTEAIDGFDGDLDMQSGWTLDADKTGKATILFIPTKYAAIDNPVDYYFGGTLTYLDPFTGLEVTRELYPVKLTVKPSPVIDLDYFVQRDVYGDDALTPEVVEPTLPAEFAVVINNKGNGSAENLRMITNQPVIIENEKGLLVDFSIVSSQLNGKAANLAFGKTVANAFGTLEPKSQAYAQWWIESSLLGHFASYDIEASHLTSYGNENLSLLDKVSIHELVHGFTVNTDDNTTMRGFLVNDIEDTDDLPDHVYFSDASDESLTIAKNASLTQQADGEFVLSVSVNGQGWVYGNLADPTSGNAKIASVIRLSDNMEIPADNLWQTYCTLVDGQEPTYEDKIHFILNLTTESETYKIIFDTKPEMQLAVEAFDGLPEQNTYITEPLHSLKVIFNKPIDSETFTTEDITLYCAGLNVGLADVHISELSPTEFNIEFNGATDEDGYYVLSVLTANIMDAEGFYGTDGKQCSWTQLSGDIAGVPDITISENEDNANLLEMYDGEVCNVSITRTIKYGSYNSITLPFDVDVATLRNVFGNDVKLKEMTNSVFADNEMTFVFENAASIEAGKPYIIKVEQNVINPQFNAVVIKNKEIVSKSEYADFVPVFNPTLLEDDNESIVFIGADNKLYYPSLSTGSMPGLRAYFLLRENVSTIKNFNLSLDDQPTIIYQVANNQVMRSEGIYTISGQKIGKVMHKGIYIINGKKVIVQ